MNEINHIILIDDDEITNFLHERVIINSGYSKKLSIFQNSKEALTYISNLPINALPDFIFLDINMPALNGWEFIDNYSSKYINQNIPTKLIMLTTSINPEDKRKASAMPIIHSFLEKPLTIDFIKELIKTN